MTASADSTILYSTDRHFSSFKFKTKLFLLRFIDMKYVDWPSCQGGPQVLVGSPSGGSILMTSHPKSASSMVAQGPTMILERSMILVFLISFIQYLNLLLYQRCMQIVYKLFPLFYHAESIWQEHKMLRIIAKVFQFMSIALYFDPRFIKMEMNNILKPNSINILLPALYSFIVILYAIIIILEFKCFNQYGTLKENKSFLKINRYIFFIVVYCQEVFYFAIGFILGLNLKWIMLGPHNVYIYLPLSCYLVIFAIHSYLLSQHRLYAGYSYVILLPMVVSQFGYVGILMMLLTYISLRKEESSIKKLYYTMILIVIAWNIMYSYEQSTELHLIEISSLVFVLIVIILLFALSQEDIYISNSLFSDNKQILKWFIQSSQEIKEKDQSLLDKLGQFEEFYFEKYSDSQSYQRRRKNKDNSADEISQAKVKEIIWKNIKENQMVDQSQQIFHLFLQVSFVLQVQMGKSFQLLRVQMRKKGSSYSKRYTMFRCLKKMFNSRQEKISHDFGMDISDLINTDALRKRLHLKLNMLINQIYHFWLELFQNSHQMSNQLFQILSIIVEREHQLEGFLKQIMERNDMGYNLQLELMIMERLSKIIDNFTLKEVKEMESNKQVKEEGILFIILNRDYQIQSLSSMLNPEVLNDNAGIFAIHNMLPYPFEQYFSIKLNQYNKTLQHSTFVLPFIMKEQKMKAMECSFHLFHNQYSELKYILHVSPLLPNTNKCFIYNANTSKIHLINATFEEYLNIELCDVQDEDRICLADLFQFEGEEIMLIEKLKEQKQIEIKMSLKRFVKLIKEERVRHRGYNSQHGNKSKNPKTVKLQLKSHTSFSEHQYLIIFFSQQSASIGTAITIQTQKNYQDHDKEKICLYKDKIVQMMNQISLASSLSIKKYMCSIFMTFFIIVIALVANVFVFDHFTKQYISFSTAIISDSSKLNNQFINLLHLFSNSYTNKLFMDQQQEVKAFLAAHIPVKNPDQSFLTLKQYFISKKDEYIEAILQTYALQKKYLYFTPNSQYKIIYDDFILQIKNHESVFFDYMSVVQAGFRNEEQVFFLVKNYNSLMKSVSSFKKNEDKIISELQTEEIYLSNLLLLSLIGLIVIVQLIIKVNISYIFNEVLSIFKLINKGEFLKIIDDMQKINLMMSSSNHNQIKQVTYQIQKLQYMPNDLLIFNEDNKELSMFQKIKTAVGMSFKHFVLYLIIIACGIVIANLQCTTVQHQKHNFHEISKLFQTVYLQSIQIEENYLYNFQKQYQKTYLKINDLTYPIRNRHDIASTEIPQLFYNYLIKNRVVCSPKYSSQLKMPVFSNNSQICNRNTTLANIDIYHELFHEYLNEISQQRNQSLNMYFTPKPSNKFSAILYLKELFQIYLKDQQNSLYALYYQYNEQIAKENTTIRLYITLLIVVIILICMYSLWDVRKKVLLVHKMMKMFPEDMMNRLNYQQYSVINKTVQKLKRL